MGLAEEHHQPAMEAMSSEEDPEAGPLAEVEESAVTVVEIRATHLEGHKTVAAGGTAHLQSSVAYHVARLAWEDQSRACRSRQEYGLGLLPVQLKGCLKSSVEAARAVLAVGAGNHNQAEEVKAAKAVGTRPGCKTLDLAVAALAVKVGSREHMEMLSELEQGGWPERRAIQCVALALAVVRTVVQ
jgi:hypothetical protein